MKQNCKSTTDLFKKLTSKVEPENIDLITELLDKISLTDFTINKLKNNIAMKSYKREAILKQDLGKAEEDLTNLKEKMQDSGDLKTELETKTKEFEEIIEEQKQKLKTSDETIEKLVKKLNDSDNNLTKLEKKSKDTEEIIAKFEIKTKELEKTIKDMEKEREVLKSKGGKKVSKAILDSEYMSKFNDREAELRTEIQDEIKKWEKFKKDFTKISKDSTKNSDKAMDEASQKIKELKEELKEIEKKLKGKTKKDREKLTKKKKSINQKLTNAKKKYESLQEDLKANYKIPDKAEKITDAITKILDKIDTLQNEYDALLKDLELDQDTLYLLFESLSRITKSAPDNFNELLAQNQEREQKLEKQLDVALKNVEELEKEMEAMDKDYHSDIQKEYERLIKQDEDKFKKLMKKQEDKYKKELAVAAQTMFELKQYIEELERGGGKTPRAVGKVPTLATPVAGGSATADATADMSVSATAYASGAQDEGMGKRGLPLKMPRNNMQETTDRKVVTVRKKKSKKKKDYEMCQCGSCGEYIPIDSQSCPKCGATFEVVEEELSLCGNCGETIYASMKECPACGAKFE